MLQEALAGRRIAITGATGFLGTALTERILRCLPETEIVVMVRPGRRGAAGRVDRDLLRNNCFDRLRRELGERFADEASGRVIPLAGDVGVDGLGLDEDGRQLLSSCSTVVHSAATVSFDSPLDAAVEINLLGPSRVAAVLRDAAANAPTKTLPHLIAVSTAYVAGGRRGPRQKLSCQKRPSPPKWRGETRLMQPGVPVRTPKRPAVTPNSWPACALPPGPS